MLTSCTRSSYRKSYTWTRRHKIDADLHYQGGAVFPAAFAVTWKGQSRAGAIAGALVGLAAGLIAWLVEAKVYYGKLTVTTTGASYPTLAGNMAGVLTGLIVTLLVSWAKPDNFDWEATRNINAPVMYGHGVATDPNAVLRGEPEGEQVRKSQEEDSKVDHSLPTVQDEDKEMLEDIKVLEDPKGLQNASRLAIVLSTSLTLIMLIIWPLPMFFTHYIFSKGFFTAWVVVSFIWVFAAIALCGILPIWETRIFWRDLFREVLSKKQKGLVVSKGSQATSETGTPRGEVQEVDSK